MVIIGDSAHAMVGFWGQGLNSALDDVMVFARVLMDAEQRGLAAEDAFVEFSEQQAKSGKAIVSMSMAHMKWFTDDISSSLWQWRQRYQELMHSLLPSWYYPPLHHIVHFYDLTYFQM